MLSINWKNQVFAGFRLFSLTLLGTLILHQNSQATTLFGSGSDRLGINVSTLSDKSYDGAQFDAFKPFSSLSSSTLKELSSFVAPAGGARLDVFLLMEAAYYDGRDKNFANKFGVVDEAGNFTNILDSASIDPNGSASFIQADEQTLSFALQSPEALFFAEDKKNKDSAPHLLALSVTKDMTIEIAQPLTRPSAPVKFQLLAGDLLIFVEDMLRQGNLGSDNVPGIGDFDFNDMVVVVRSTQIPEPGTALLISAGLLGLYRRRRQS